MSVFPQVAARSIGYGYYKRAGHPATYLIVVDELPITAKNYGLLLFGASEDKFREFLEQVVVARDMSYLRYAYEIRPQVTKEVLVMAGISSTLSRKDLKFMAEDIGPELVAFLEPEDVMKGMNKKKQLRLLNAMLAKLAEEMGTENLLTELNPDIQQKFTEAASQKQVPNLPSNQGKNGHDSPDNL